MFEKVNPSHPDKVADRIAGAIVDLAYLIDKNPKIAVEVLVGHGICHIICETSVHLKVGKVVRIVRRIAGNLLVDYREVPQDVHLSKNQNGKIRCGDNGIFKGVPVTDEEKKLTKLAKEIYDEHLCDGKYIIDGDKLIICQSNVLTLILKDKYPNAIMYPIINT